MITFVLGGARSGKSQCALDIATSYDDVVFIATAEALDSSMQQRINKHKTERPSHWMLIEEPINVSKSLIEKDVANRCFVIDCLTLWLSNCMHRDSDNWLSIQDEFIQMLPQLSADVIIVSNEVGQGITPINALAREFVDLAGRLHQDIAAVADNVYFCTAGLVQVLKGVQEC